MKRYFKRFVGMIVLLLIFIVQDVKAVDVLEIGEKSTSGIVSLPVEVTYGQSEARKMLDMINEFRQGDEAWIWNSDNKTKTVYTNLGALSYDYNLEKIAMQRAAEIAFNWAHTRSDGSAINSMFVTYRGYGENIAAGMYDTMDSATEAFMSWKEDSEDYDGQCHRRTMLQQSAVAVGVGHVIYAGNHYWVMELGYPASRESATVANDATSIVEVDVLESSIDTINFSVVDNIKLTLGSNAVSLPEISVNVTTTTQPFPAQWSVLPIKASPVWISSDSSIVKVENNLLYPVGAGKTTIQTTILGKTATVYVLVEQQDETDTKDEFGTNTGGNKEEVKENTDEKKDDAVTDKEVEWLKEGILFTKGKIQYKITKNTKTSHKVAVYKGKNKSIKTLNIPEAVEYKGVKYDVVSINKNAFKEYKKVTKLTIGSKVTSIGESAFQNCTKLKTVTIGNEVTSIGKKAFYGCKALTSVSIPSKVKAIGESAFSNCTKLKNVIIGSSVKTIGESVFKGDSKIISINIYSEKLSKVGKSALSGIDKYAKIYVPDSKLSAYKKLLKNKGQKSTVKIVKQGETKYTGKSVIAIGNCEISYEKEFKYTGKAIKPKVTVTYNNSTLMKGTNYTVSYKNNTEPGTATIVIKGKGIYVGTVEKNFTIYSTDIGWPIKDSGQFEIWGLDYYKTGSKHNGIDITPLNDQTRKIAIYPISEGTVEQVGYGESTGYYVIIKHTISDETYMSYYFHMESKSELKKGNIVDENTLLGYMGSTGDSTGKHLHFSIVKQSKAWDDEYKKQNAKTFQYYVDTKSVIPKGIRFSTSYIKIGKSEYCSWIKNNCTKEGSYYVYN